VERIKTRAEVSETETKRAVQQINETKSWFFKNVK
jgi:hypothetical protein